ncbi:hypothetical protein RWZ02_14215 [Clostridium butyricum]|uniref:hypothetical protein n=1 Tax=Clostridium TaxID=1485 RepID=UPI0008A4798D|nr:MULTISPECIES: hypothetical protein [Clostridium]MDU0323828.1 hypothetical protein [Clostridium butyricum]OFS21005.1 hypothetical protein HMPREF3070_16030 [Clostridium sp. HMSC19A10]
MKTYRELYFKGTPKKLSEFIEQIGKYAVEDWKLVEKSERWKEYLFFDYVGNSVDKGRVSIYIGNQTSKEELRVGNIIPIEKNELTVDEYNAILLKFYNDVIKPYKESGTDLSISQPSDDVFDPTSVISKEALKKLEVFCSAANKSTGSSHPCDQERWFDFICQTVDDGRMFDYSNLCNFLQDETYWGEKPDSFIGVMGKFAWDEEHASELALEYENLCEILTYYKKTRGV